MNRKSIVRLLLPLLILGLAVMVAASMVSGKPKHKKPKPGEKVWLVDVLTAQRSALAPSLTLYGKVESSALLKAAAPGAGVIDRLNVLPGDRVRAGQVLLEMDQRDFMTAVAQARAEVDDVRAQLTGQALKYAANVKSLQQEKTLLQLARAEVQRIERLKSKNLSSESALSNAHEMLGKQELAVIARQLEVDRDASTRQQLQARLAQARARLQQAQLARQRSTVIAVADAVVSAVNVAAGDRVRSGDHLLTLYALDSLQLRASIPVRYQQEIQQALAAGVVLRAQASMSGQTIDMRLLRLAGAASLSGIDGFFQIERGGDNLRHGNLVKFKLQRPLQHRVIAIPFTAIYGNNRVFVLRDGRMVAIDVVSVGQLDRGDGQGQLLIRSEQIADDDKIIITHLPNAVDGLKVKTGTGENDA